MSLKQLAIGETICIYALMNLGHFFTSEWFLWSLFVVGVLWIVEQFGFGSVKRPVRRNRSVEN